MDRERTTYASAALGFRSWQITEEGWLHSTGLGSVTWRPQSNSAYCQHGHPAPKSECSCGFYAYHKLDSVKLDLDDFRQLQQDAIVGAVACRGKLETSYHGWRGEEVVILALAALSSKQNHQLQAKEIAERYQVPLVPFEQLENFAGQYAQPVPFREIPGKPKPSEQRELGHWSKLLAFLTLFSVILSSLLVLIFLINQGTNSNLSNPEQSARQSLTLLSQELKVNYIKDHKWPLNLQQLTAYAPSSLWYPGLIGTPLGGCYLLVWENNNHQLICPDKNSPSIKNKDGQPLTIK